MEPETELTQSWSPELAALSEKGGLLKGIPLQIGGEMRTFSLPMPQDDDGTDISLKDWQLGPRSSLDREATAPYAIKPFKGSVRTRFTPVEPRLDEDQLSSRGQSSPDHFETPTTPRTPRTSSSGGTRSSSVSPSKSFLHETVDPSRDPSRNQTLDSTTPDGTTSQSPPHPPAIAFDITLQDQTPEQTLNTESTLRTRSLRVSFKESANSQTPPQQRPSAPIVRQRSPLKSRSILPSKEVKALQPKWESSTKIRLTSTSSSFPVSKPHVQAPLHGIKTRKSSTTPGAKRARAAVVAPVALPAPEIEPERELQGSSGYLSEGRYLSSGREFRRSLDSHPDDEYGSHRLSRELTMSPIHRSGREVFPQDFESARVTQSPSLNRSQGRRSHSGRYGDNDSDDDEDVKGGMLCGGGLSDTKLSGDFVRLLSKLCRVSVPAPSKQTLSKSASSQQQRRGRKFERSNTTTALSWDSATANAATTRENVSIIGRHDSLKLLSERCSNAPAPSYNLHKPRKIRDHEPHQHFYKTISKTLDRKLKS